MELVQDLAGIAEVEDDWRRLAVRRENAFLTPEWFRSWWRHYGADHEPLICVCRTPDGRLRGIMPLAVCNAARPRIVRFAGSALGDYFHPVSSVEDEVAVVRGAAVALDRVREQWSAIVLENVDAGAAWPQQLARGGSRALTTMRDRPSELPYTASLDLGWSGYLASRSRGLRGQVRRKRRRLADSHRVNVRWSEEAEVAADMRTLFRLHDARWGTREGTSSLTSPTARAFHADFAAAAHARGWLRLCFLELDGQPVAGWYGWRVGDRYAYYQAGFDPRWSTQSVGFVLFAETIRAAIEEGASRYDMLLGNERFKARFADASRPVHTVVMTPRLHPTRIVTTAEVLLRGAGRKLPPALLGPVRRGSRGLTERLAMARSR